MLGWLLFAVAPCLFYHANKAFNGVGLMKAILPCWCCRPCLTPSPHG